MYKKRLYNVCVQFISVDLFFKLSRNCSMYKVSLVSDVLHEPPSNYIPHQSETGTLLSKTHVELSGEHLVDNKSLLHF